MIFSILMMQSMLENMLTGDNIKMKFAMSNQTLDQPFESRFQ